ncbi:MAG: hypothetical protein NW201_00150 [Gemmatimonadales bacterium]|nr:hypothetical protein [Gemmatimonadales bacterium]
MSVRLSPRTALAAALVALAACGGSDPNAGGQPFNAATTNTTVAAVNGALESPQMNAFRALSATFGPALGATQSPVVTALQEATSEGPARGAFGSARALTQLAAAAATGIPTVARGKTFEWSTQLNRYVAGSRAGAPAAGVRFILYSAGPGDRTPTLPLAEIGRVDLIDESNGNAIRFRIIGVAGQVEFLNYLVSGTGSNDNGTFTVAGSVRNGNDAVDFTVNATFTLNAQLVGRVRAEYTINVPSRQYTSTATVVVDFGAQGLTGVSYGVQMTVGGTNIAVSGAITSPSAPALTLEVRVNSALFATISTGANGITVAGANGRTLTTDERQAIEKVGDLVDRTSQLLDELLAPVEALLG